MNVVKKLGKKAAGGGGAKKKNKNKDPVDKGVEAVEKHTVGVKAPRAVNEKVTDAGRKGVEGATGKDVPAKVSR